MKQISNLEKIKSLVRDLPDSQGATRFFQQLSDKYAAGVNKLLKNESLLSDVLTLASFSPLLASTLLQNPEYIDWLARERGAGNVRSKEELLESLARFSLTNSQIPPQILLARFRRRELMRIYLRDIRRLGTIAEITEEISQLADAILEYALQIARQELDNRYGTPLEADEKGRAGAAQFCVVSLGKLGSYELNYSSDIDLLFLYSSAGATSGQGARGSVTNREYFVKLVEMVTKIVGGQTGEGAAYRVDLRLRPHGRVGALAISLNEAVNYYQTSARDWERQTLIRSRASAGDAGIFKKFFRLIESNVYSTFSTIEDALSAVKVSKEKINLQHQTERGFNVKLGQGGIREIEFIAQALQLAFGGKDSWLRASHTLISLTRLADRKLLIETELTELFDAYEFLRRVEHRLQMEHGLQTHLVPNDSEKRKLLARRMTFADLAEFDSVLQIHTANVYRIFRRIFVENVNKSDSPFEEKQKLPKGAENFIGENLGIIQGKSASEFGFKAFSELLSSIKKSGTNFKVGKEKILSLQKFSEVSPHFAEILCSAPYLVNDLPNETDNFVPVQYDRLLISAVEKQKDFSQELAALRTVWRNALLQIAAFDAFEKISLAEAKRRQTELAEASLKAAFLITKRELERRFDLDAELALGVLGLGKLGGRGMDYGSDLDLVLIYDDENPLPNSSFTPAEFYSRAAEIFVSALSSFTRGGNLYRVDLRLRPDGKNGATSLGKLAFLYYLKTRSAIWEWLAYVKLRGVSGAADLALDVEKEARATVHEKALKIDKNELKNETRRVRDRLEQEKLRGAKTVDIKYGAGGMLDIYFTARFLQLRDNVPDDSQNRSTVFTLEKLREMGSLNEGNFSAFTKGYEFLSELDHILRLTLGRSTQIPAANPAALGKIAGRMKLDSDKSLLEQLTFHRLEIRAVYEKILE